MKPVTVSGLGLWMPGFAGVDAWLGGEADPEVQKPVGEGLAPRSRRRTSFMTRMGADAASQAIAAAGAQPESLPTIFGSAYGELGTTERLLNMLGEDDGALSPTAFHNSVHNTTSGYLSIAWRNHRFTTSIAAGFETVPMCLLEAQSFLHCGAAPEVLVVLADIAVPEAFLGEAQPNDASLAVALLLRAGAPGGVRLSMQRGEAPAQTPPMLAANPCASALALVRAVRDGQQTTLGFGAGAFVAQLNPAEEAS